MVARDALHRMNGSAGLFLVKPLVVIAARALGPGPTRLKLVKLAHNLSTHTHRKVGGLDLPAEQPEPTRRAA